MKQCLLGILAAWACWAWPQTLSGQDPALLLPELRGDAAMLERAERARGVVVPDWPRPPAERPTGQSISVAQLQHKVPKAARQAFERARKRSRKGDHSGAAMELETCIRLDPELAAAHNQLGIEYAQAKRIQEALASFQRAQELAPNDWNIQFNIGVELLQAGDAPAAERLARRGLDLSPHSSQAHLLLGLILSQRDETRTEGMDHLAYGARTHPEARRYLKSLQAK